MKFEYQFVGGPLNGAVMDELDAALFSNGRSEDLSAIRNAGGCVHRVELDNQPTFTGYLGPMWNGVRALDNGEQCATLRYETQEVYDELSH